MSLKENPLSMMGFGIKKKLHNEVHKEYMYIILHCYLRYIVYMKLPMFRWETEILNRYLDYVQHRLEVSTDTLVPTCINISLQFINVILILGWTSE